MKITYTDSDYNPIVLVKDGPLPTYAIITRGWFKKQVAKVYRTRESVSLSSRDDGSTYLNLWRFTASNSLVWDTWLDRLDRPWYDRMIEGLRADLQARREKSRRAAEDAVKSDWEDVKPSKGPPKATASYPNLHIHPAKDFE